MKYRVTVPLCVHLSYLVDAESPDDAVNAEPPPTYVTFDGAIATGYGARLVMAPYVDADWSMAEVTEPAEQRGDE